MRLLALLALVYAAHAGAVDMNEVDRVRQIVLQSRQAGAHGLGYGERSLKELSRKLKPADVPALIVLLDNRNRSAAIGATFGLASQCGAAIDPVGAIATGASENLLHFSDAREVLEQLANFKACARADRARALEKVPLIDEAERDYSARGAEEIRHRDTEDARLQAEGLKMLDPLQRAVISREDCLRVAERNRAATGIRPGANAEADVLFERLKANCVQHGPK